MVTVLYCLGHSQLKYQKLRVGGYTEEALKWFNYPRARLTLDVVLVPGGTASSLCLCFVETSPTVEKTVSCYKADYYIALLPVRLSLAACKSRAAGEAEKNAANKATDGCGRTFEPDVMQSTSGYVSLADLQCTFRFTTTQEFTMSDWRFIRVACGKQKFRSFNFRKRLLTHKKHENTSLVIVTNHTIPVASVVSQSCSSVSHVVRDYM